MEGETGEPSSSQGPPSRHRGTKDRVFREFQVTRALPSKSPTPSQSKTRFWSVKRSEKVSQLGVSKLRNLLYVILCIVCQVMEQQYIDLQPAVSETLRQASMFAADQSPPTESTGGL